MNIFAQATRQKLRFESAKGALNVEQLWDLPMTSEKGVSLNGIGTVLQKSIREMGEDSLVQTSRKDPKKAKAELALDVIKEIIAVKQAEAADAKAASEKAAKREQLLAALETKEQEAVLGMSAEQIKAQLAAL